MLKGLGVQGQTEADGGGFENPRSHKKVGPHSPTQEGNTQPPGQGAFHGPVSAPSKKSSEK